MIDGVSGGAGVMERPVIIAAACAILASLHGLAGATGVTTRAPGQQYRTVDPMRDNYVRDRLAAGDTAFAAGNPADDRVVDYFYFTGMQGQVLRIQVESLAQGLDPLLGILDEGMTWGMANDDDWGRDSCLRVTLPRSGGYLIAVSSSSKQGTRAQYGDYALHLMPGGGPGCNTAGTPFDPGVHVGGEQRSGEPPSEETTGSDLDWSGPSSVNGESIRLRLFECHETEDGPDLLRRVEVGVDRPCVEAVLFHLFAGPRDVVFRYREIGSQELRTWERHIVPRPSSEGSNPVRKSLSMVRGSFACAEVLVLDDGREILYVSLAECR